MRGLPPNITFFLRGQREDTSLDNLAQISDRLYESWGWSPGISSSAASSVRSMSTTDRPFYDALSLPIVPSTPLRLPHPILLDFRTDLHPSPTPPCSTPAAYICSSTARAPIADTRNASKSDLSRLESQVQDVLRCLSTLKSHLTRPSRSRSSSNSSTRSFSPPRNGLC